MRSQSITASVSLICQQCGAAFIRSARDVERGRVRYCSKRCSHDSRKGQRVVGAPASTPLEERFWRRVLKQDGDGCWFWQGAHTKAGYGVIGRGGPDGGKMTTAHRISYEIHHGLIEDPTMVVCHTCDNPPCVRPDHLFLGTQAENLADRDRKGHRISPSGLGRGKGKKALSPAEVAAIKQLYADGLSQTKIAALYGVWQTTVSRVVLGQTHSKLT